MKHLLPFLLLGASALSATAPTIAIATHPLLGTRYYESMDQAMTYAPFEVWVIAGTVCRDDIACHTLALMPVQFSEAQLPE